MSENDHLHEWIKDVREIDGVSVIWWKCEHCTTPLTPEEITARLNATEILGGPIGWGYDGMEWGSYITIPKEEWKKYAELVGLPTDWIPE